MICESRAVAKIQSIKERFEFFEGRDGGYLKVGRGEGGLVRGGGDAIELCACVCLCECTEFALKPGLGMK